MAEMRDTDMIQEQGRSYTGFGEEGRNRTARDSSGRISGHKLVMEGRERVELTGVTEVLSFDNEEIRLETVAGAMRFSGEDLHVKRLTLERGEVALEGHINEICYYESSHSKTAGSFISRLFR